MLNNWKAIKLNNRIVIGKEFENEDDAVKFLSQRKAVTKETARKQIKKATHILKYADSKGLIYYED